MRQVPGPSLSLVMAHQRTKTKKGEPELKANQQNFKMIYKDYLTVPKDAVKMMMTPPMPALDPTESLPPLFQLFPEEEPRPEDLLPHDIEAPAGMVSVNDGTYLAVEESENLLGREGIEFGYEVTRRKIIKNKDAPTFVIDFYQK